MKENKRKSSCLSIIGWAVLIMLISMVGRCMGRMAGHHSVERSGIKGGFVKNEIFSKDNPQEIYSGVLSYVLQLQRDGNFQTKGSSKGEVFL